MKTFATYRVFGRYSAGGKTVAVGEWDHQPDQELQAWAAQAGPPLVAFARLDSPRQASARFFNATREKGPSDSGAMAVAEHFRLQERVDQGVRLEMGEEYLELVYEELKWWTLQGDFAGSAPATDPEGFLEELALASHFPAIWTGQLASPKRNLVVWLPRERDLLGWQPPMEALAVWLGAHGTNGLVVAQWQTYPERVNLRFFAPHKGLPEDNAGSYTLASLAGYLAAEVLGTGFYQIEAWQGTSSQLWVRFEVEDGQALGVEVGGSVEWIQEGA